ncbi:MAG: Beta-N-acetylhexosaminidase [Naasia sp.]|uniref:beta-N-acetylhexosaminidase n=1 Tax=Naasia sp. TaxID=2546198 RepID=UPI00262C0972|nr:beta-N-acetylhexosaminidase [Naasia sp.]MCU1571490.1 Beta-N-acetylhexosaminidase [Naasia sp.]
MSITALGLVPEPRSVELRGGRVTLGAPVTVTRRVDPSLPSEAYVLEVDDAGIRIRGGSAAGVFYGGQTLLQLLPTERIARVGGDVDAALRIAPVDLPRVRIEDQPAYPWRGFMLDVARHFFPVDFVLKMIDQLAAHKMNVLHLHLTDDQGWRIPIPGYPRLTQVGAWRPETAVGFDHERPEIEHDGEPHGGAYTREELEHIVGYAAERFVDVVPEVDLPGHASAALAAYPEFGNGAEGSVRTRWGISTQILNLEDPTLDFVSAVFTEVMSIFPSTWIHGGGDEVPKREWRESAAVQRKKTELGLPSEEHLQGWFTAQVDRMLRRHGRRLVAWDEVVTGEAPLDTLVMAWRSTAHGINAVLSGYDVIMSPSEYVYLDHRQSRDPDEPLTFPDSPLTLARVFAFEPMPAALRGVRARGSVVGAQVHLWTEYVPTVEHAQYMTFPRLCAFAEAVWRQPLEEGRARDFADFMERLDTHLGRLRARGVLFRGLHPAAVTTRTGALRLHLSGH